MLSSLDRLPDDPAALKAIILAQQEEVARLTASARAYEALVQALKIRIARLQLTLEDLEDPGARCPECGGVLRLVGEDLSEILDFIAAKLKVVETARLKKSCRSCEKMVQPSAPTRPIRRGMIGPGLLAHILVSKFDDHLPLLL
jgi:transposase